MMSAAQQAVTAHAVILAQRDAHLSIEQQDFISDSLHPALTCVLMAVQVCLPETLTFWW